jgi:hypothetical protein
MRREGGCSGRFSPQPAGFLQEASKPPINIIQNILREEKLLMKKSAKIKA